MTWDRYRMINCQVWDHYLQVSTPPLYPVWFGFILVWYGIVWLDILKYYLAWNCMLWYHQLSYVGSLLAGRHPPAIDSHHPHSLPAILLLILQVPFLQVVPPFFLLLFSYVNYLYVIGLMAFAFHIFFWIRNMSHLPSYSYRRPCLIWDLQRFSISILFQKWWNFWAPAESSIVRNKFQGSFAS